MHTTHTWLKKRKERTEGGKGVGDRKRGTDINAGTLEILFKIP